ncbi:MAG: PEP-CTERM sorting domain-containing protein [Phycisphaerales bacterium]|nr:PEP-CTERM sorting domain-containing protein [Phycisphaerales bacterium]
MKKTVVCVVACAAAAASAQTPIGPFSGGISETWEGFQTYSQNPNFYEDANGPISTFGGNAMVSSQWSGQGGILVVYSPFIDGFGLGNYGLAGVSDGQNGMGINTGFPGSPVKIDFATPVTDFGGYWGAAEVFGNPSAPIQFDFYDANGGLVGSTTEHYADFSGTLHWFGWNFNSIGPVKTVVYTGDFVVNDGLQANLVPTPASLALAGLGVLALGRRRR